MINRFRKYLLISSFLALILGQLPGIILGFHLLDFLVFLFVLSLIPDIVRGTTPIWVKSGITFWLLGVFSLFINAENYSLQESAVALLFGVRFVTYVLFMYSVSLYAKSNALKLELVGALAASGVVVAFIGIGQYLLLPDIRYFSLFGWDDHYFRLVSTILDPAFTGIILVLAILTLLSKAKQGDKFVLGPLLLLVVVALALTFSRASYLALFVGIVIYSYFAREFKKGLLTLILLLLLLPIVPKPAGEGVNLLRTNSLVEKMENNDIGLNIVRRAPVFGVGFNAVCPVQVSHFGVDASSHSCNGLDNSYLFILATTGSVGAIIYGWFAYRVLGAVSDRSGALVYASLSAIAVHALFTNTLFYLTILFWLAVLLGVSVKPLQKGFVKRKHYPENAA